jgi:hypothetical protein
MKGQGVEKVKYHAHRVSLLQTYFGVKPEIHREFTNEYSDRIGLPTRITHVQVAAIAAEFEGHGPDISGRFSSGLLLIGRHE